MLRERRSQLGWVTSRRYEALVGRPRVRHRGREVGWRLALLHCGDGRRRIVPPERPLSQRKEIRALAYSVGEMVSWVTEIRQPFSAPQTVPLAPSGPFVTSRSAVTTPSSPTVTSLMPP